MKNRFFKGGTKNHKTTKKPEHTSNSVILSIEKFRLSLKPEPIRRIPTARIGSGCSIGAETVYWKEASMHSIRSGQIPRPDPSILPGLSVGIPRDTDRPAMAVPFYRSG